MIQRIQSLFLLAVAVLHLLLFFLPMWVAVSGPDSAGLNAMGMVCIGALCKSADMLGDFYHWGIILLNTIIMLLSFGIIFLYRNRLRQMRLTRLLMLLEVAFIVFAFLAIEELKTLFSGTENGYSIGIAFPVVSLIFLFLAWWRILHDERLVRSADRLR